MTDMRDLGITVVVALLIVLAGFRFWGYQKQLAQEPGPGRGEESAETIQIEGESVKIEKTETAAVPQKSPEKAAPVEAKSYPTSSAASLEVRDQAAGSLVTVSSLVIPEGSAWVAVHEGQKTLGARLFAKGSASGVVELLRATVKGQTYTVTLRKDDGDGKYNRTLDSEFADASGKALSLMFKAL